jgi:hypothetical protein
MAKTSKAKPFKIKKGLSIPRTSQGKKPIYPFRQMKVGDALSMQTTKDFEKARRASAAFSRRNDDFVFTSRTGVVDGKKSKAGGTIWRVE